MNLMRTEGRIILIISFLLSMSGCVPPLYYPRQVSPQAVAPQAAAKENKFTSLEQRFDQFYNWQPVGKKTVQINSEPAGARIEVNNETIGFAPLSLDIQYSEAGTAAEDVLIIAYPNEPGHCVQSKLFMKSRRTPVFLNKLPSAIYFDMRLCSPVHD